MGQEARKRILRHVEALMATAALASVACSAKGTDKSDAGTTDGRRKSTGSGYEVVDPVPVPSRCSKDSSTTITATATGSERPDRKWEVVAKLTVSGGQKLKSVDAFPDATATMEAEAGSATIKAVVNTKTYGSVNLRVALECSDKEQGEVMVEVTWRKGHERDNPYNVRVVPTGGTMVWGGSGSHI